MQLPYSETLDIQYLGKFFENTSECYKLFWFQAILTKLDEGRTELTFEELVDEMIADAWYMVSEYHLNLGPRDNLERLVHYMHETTGMKPAEDKQTILKFLRECNDREIIRYKKILIDNVPYRLQAPLMTELRSSELDGNVVLRIERINRQTHLLYYFGAYNGLDTIIRLQEDWVRYLQKNRSVIQGWLQYHMIRYLQRRNPSVPGIADKLYPPQERNLKRVIQYWKLITELQPVKEIYGNNIITPQQMSIDHFVPWSYVAHDEFWNLHPTTKSINSSKSNHLADWETYFIGLANLQYESYQMMWQCEAVRKEFDKCAREHLNNEEIEYRLYRQEGLEREPFANMLADIIRPVYNAAQNSGFGRWIYQSEQHNRLL